MKTVITRVSVLLIGALLFSAALCAQVDPNQPFPDQFVAAGINFDQASAPQVQGFVAYAKLTSKDVGLYSFTKISETSISLKPAISVQTQTETGVCAYAVKFGAFDVFACGTGGIATAGGSSGLSGSGTVLITKALSKGWTVGIAGGPSYSAVLGKLTYPVGLVFGWGK